MRKIKLAYRSDHMLVVYWPARDAGIWSDYGLDIDWIDCCSIDKCPYTIVKGIDYKEQPDYLVQKLLDGSLDIVSGLHFEPYLKKYQQKDEQIVYFGQAVNNYPNVLVVSPDSRISGLEDLRGTALGVSNSAAPEFQKNVDTYFQLNNLNAKRDSISLSMMSPKDGVEALQQGKIDALLLHPPQHVKALQRGLKIVKVPPLPVIYHITPLAVRSFLAQNPEIVEAYLLGLRESIRYFKKEKAKVIQAINKYFGYMFPRDAFGDSPTLDKDDEEQLATLYEGEKELLNESLLPDPLAIQNTYKATRDTYPGEELVEPLAAWDLRYVQDILAG